MPAPLSIIIPTLDVAAVIGPCLGALGSALGDGVIREVILTDGGSQDGIAAVADAVGARLVTGGRGRGAQLGAGARVARGDWLLFLHADTRLSPGWGEAVLRHIATHPGHAGYFRLRFDAEGLAPRLVAGWANLRARRLGLAWGDQGLLISRRLYDEVGGYPSIPLMEDVALVRRLQRRLRPLAAVAVTAATRYEQEGWLRQGARNWWLLAAYAWGVPPEVLAARYRGGGHG